ncbi:MAG: radical SAM protein [Firmicutes bacterium]|nr:radical SAM protein [Bacillota bacterium]
MAEKRAVLIAFHNTKALGVRYLEPALRRHGYEVSTVFFKGFNSRSPRPVSKAELDLLCGFIEERRPFMIGLSVMSSMYLDTVNSVIDELKNRINAPIVCGGAFATMFPDRFLERGAEYVIRCDGEIPIQMLADFLTNRDEAPLPADIPSLCYTEDGYIVKNEIGGMLEDIDEYGIPAVECEDACYIENDTLRTGDPQLSTMSYEVIASRGCPFTCSYCCCVNLHRLHPKGIKPVRTRSVKSVIDELVIAKHKLKKLVFIHFYDEIFPNLPGWVDEFVSEYKKKINMPFTIWSHPKMIDGDVLKKLVSVGLSEVIMGIQSGSDHIRRDVFHRYETRDDIINATKIIKESGVAFASYDFMLQHPFETIDDLKDTYFLVKDMYMPFELQLHGLNFLPGTDIVDMAIETGLLTPEEMDAIMYAPMGEQFGAYWKREDERESRLWYRMIYCLQFKQLRIKIEKCENDPFANESVIDSCYKRAQSLAKLAYLRKKSSMVFKSKVLGDYGIKRNKKKN